MAMLPFSIGDIGGILTSAREMWTGEKIKDPVEMAKIELQYKELENQSNNGQLEINKIEAQSNHWFVASWRPMVGWVCGVSLGLMFIPKALVLTAMWTYQCYLAINGETMVIQLPNFPDLGIGDVIALLGALLGVGTLRTYEKAKGVDTKVISK